MRIYFIFWLLIILSACKNPLTHELHDYGDEFELTLGDTVIVGVDKIPVEFIDVLEDSRCPSNVTCIWSGNGKVEIRFAQENIRLNTHLEPREVMLIDVKIQLLSLDPYPEHPFQIEKDDYKIRLLITKR